MRWDRLLGLHEGILIGITPIADGRGRTRAAGVANAVLICIALHGSAFMAADVAGVSDSITTQSC